MPIAGLVMAALGGGHRFLIELPVSLLGKLLFYPVFKGEEGLRL